MLESGSPRWLRLLLMPAVALFVLLVTSQAQAYTWMIKHGYKACNVCHTDPSGGETLSPYGRLMMEEALSMRWGEPDDSATYEFLFGAVKLPETLNLGGSARVAYTLKGGDFRVFPMQLDVYGNLQLGEFRVGGSVGVAKVPTGSPHARAAQVTAGQGDEWNLIARNYFVGMDFMEKQLTLRAGRLNLPFGLRVPEHTMWVREATRTDRESDQQHGVALAYNGESVRSELMAIAGNYQINPDEFRERGYSLYLEYFATSRAGVGISSLVTKASRDRLFLEETDVLRMSHGAYLRATIADPVVLLAELDMLKRSAAEIGYVGMAQLDVEPIQGLHFLATGELLDQGYPEGGGPGMAPRAPGAGKPKLGVWGSVAWFFFNHFDVRFDAIKRQGEDFYLLGQLHAYL